MISYAEMRKKQVTFLKAMKDNATVNSVVDRVNKLLNPTPPKVPKSPNDWKES